MIVLHRLPTLPIFWELTHASRSELIGLRLPKVSTACLLAVSAVAPVLHGPCDSPVISPPTNTTIQREETAWQCLKCAPSQSNIMDMFGNLPLPNVHHATHNSPLLFPEA